MNELFDVAGKTVCVTGASSGLGRESARYLATCGARVIGVARRRDQLEQWQQETKGETAIVCADLSSRDSLKEVTDSIVGCFGASPDILINAAGINTRETADAVTTQGWDITLSLNLTIPFFLAQAFAPQMQLRGWGRIINFASLQSRRAFHGGIAYGASKGGVEQLTRAMAEAWSNQGICVNALAPGFFPSELTAPVFGNTALAEKNAQQTCIGRNGTLDDLHGPLLFLCSDACGYVTGQTVFVDGGFTAK